MERMTIACTSPGSMPGLFAYAARVLRCASPLEKVRLTREAAEAWNLHHTLGAAVAAPATPARPKVPEIVPPESMPSVREYKGTTNVYVIHMLAHVELNAIDLSLDTLLRFASSSACPSDFAADFLSIAVDEASHFEMLDGRLRALGSFYGALPAHDIVWNAADKSVNCSLRRLALGQLVQEARGLDAGPRLANRLIGTGDVKSAKVVEIIAEEELRHVQIGVKWFFSECTKEGKEPVKTFHEIAMKHANPGAFAPPFDEARRREAGLEPEWYLPVAEQMRKHMEDVRKKRAEDWEINGMGPKR